MAIRIICVGKRHDPLLSGAIDDYQKRLRPPFDVEWVILPPSSQDGLSAREDESRRLLDKLQPAEYVIALDERGSQLDSPGFAHAVQGAFNTGKKVVIIIGGAYGVTASLRERAHLVWSLSPLVFPHQLVRLLLIEQLYRAQTIVSGQSYHHA